MEAIHQYSFIDIPFEQLREFDSFGCDKVEIIRIEFWPDRHFSNNAPTGSAAHDLSGKYSNRKLCPQGIDRLTAILMLLQGL
jgi:hypothetical protein